MHIFTRLLDYYHFTFMYQLFGVSTGLTYILFQLCITKLFLCGDKKVNSFNVGYFKTVIPFREILTKIIELHISNAISVLILYIIIVHYIFLCSSFY
ncbi:hypothetical protein RIR_jg36707.t1 [Rhizophagus irregularis DAOM 181602=DAOM 197198]|uniref:Uncharacterized protein n=1 Tax=Rhizophagus irregularis TaxID=588596 RepID=A0A2N1N4J9_9GLOM|nr:hypothetical protein RhiirC2_528233 [Rhizophagus irregularis]GET63021.1 hypothetical protein RIR_jg36707.t1 [Rhizophagus irregularis DAOM 181602=DAOM 197198]